MKKYIVLVTLLSSTFAWSDALYTDTYMQNIKKTNVIVSTGIENGVSASTLADGKYSRILRLNPLYFQDKELTDESKKTLEDVLFKLKSKSYYISIIGHTSDYVETGHDIELNAWSSFWQSMGGEDLSKSESISLGNENIKVVYDILIENKVDRASIYTENRLGKDGISTEATSLGRSLNNRVDITFYLK